MADASPSRIAVVGGSLAGMAVAARLARLGHQVILFEATGTLGGHWRKRGLGPVIDFPAPWRDLFKKSGRALDATLAAHGLAWTPAPPIHHQFTDGTTLDMPAERGAQFETLTNAYSRAEASAWRDLLDRLDQVWQVVRTSAETMTDRQYWHRFRSELMARHSIEDLAASLTHPHLGALVRQTAWDRGLEASHTPAYLACRLSRERTFGRWELTGADGVTSADSLWELVTDRLAERGVEVRTNTAVEWISGLSVHARGTQHPVAAVISAISPAKTCRLTRSGWRQRPLRRAARIPAATAPLVSVSEHAVTTFTVDHPGRRFEWPTPGTNNLPNTTSTATSWDWSAGSPDLAAGPRWSGIWTWQNLIGPRISAGHYAVGPTTITGADPAGCLLSAALTSYLVHEDLTGEDVRPTSKNPPSRRQQANPSRLVGR